MKRFVWGVPILLLVLSSCQNKTDELEKKMADMQAQNRQLSQEMASRDEYIETVTQAVNGVYENLESVRAKEKLLLHQTNEMEANKKLSSQEVRVRLLHQIAEIDSNLQGNRQTVAGLQSKISNYKTQYAGLKNMIANLQQTIADREHSIAELQNRIQGLETQVSEKTMQLTQRDSVIEKQHSLIDAQQTRLVTGFYVAGTRKELEEKGIIKNEGGFLWGLFGATTVLTSGFNSRHFNPINKFSDTTIEIDGRIDEIVPKRNVEFYRQSSVDRKHSTLTIAQPTAFWQNNYLVIITD
jgi:uncharacterized protein YoxC